MKRIIAIGAMLLLVTSIFAVTSNPAKGGVADAGMTTDGKSATLDYTLNTNALDSFEVGFSETPIKGAEDVPTTTNITRALTLEEGDDLKAINGDLYVYWKIISPTPCTVSLSATSLKLDDTNSIKATFSTSGDADDNGDFGTIVSSGVETNSTETPKKIGDLLEFKTTTYADHQAVGSQKINIVTETLAGKAAGTYTGTITLTIKADGPSA